jgi:hypothetical protein
MADEENKGGSNTGVAAMIPEVYYDLIARVPAGCLVVVVCLATVLSAQGKQIPNISIWLTGNGISSLLIASAVMGIGGIVGILLSPVASAWRRLYWKRAWLAVVEKGPHRRIGTVLSKVGYKALPETFSWLTLRQSDFDGIDRWVYDYLQRESPIARSILPKLRAEADLSSYLAASLSVIPPIHFVLFASLCPKPSSCGISFASCVPDAPFLWYGLAWTVSCLLCFSGEYRTKRLILRMLSMLSVIAEGVETEPAVQKTKKKDSSRTAYE